jgi:hypothetical protein
VIRAFPSWNRSTLTEIYLCHACSDHEIEGGNGAPGCSSCAKMRKNLVWKRL